MRNVSIAGELPSKGKVTHNERRHPDALLSHQICYPVPSNQLWRFVCLILLLVLILSTHICSSRVFLLLWSGFSIVLLYWPILSNNVSSQYNQIQKLWSQGVDPLPGSLPNSLPQSVPKPQPSQHVEDSAVWSLGSMVPWCLDPPSGAWVPIFPPHPFLKWFCKQPSPSVPHLLKSRGVPLSQNQKYPPNSPCFFLSS